MLTDRMPPKIRVQLNDLRGDPTTGYIPANYFKALTAATKLAVEASRLDEATTAAASSPPTTPAKKKSTPSKGREAKATEPPSASPAPDLPPKTTKIEWSPICSRYWNNELIVWKTKYGTTSSALEWAKKGDKIVPKPDDAARKKFKEMDATKREAMVSKFFQEHPEHPTYLPKPPATI